MDLSKLNALTDQLVAQGMLYAPKLALALLTLFVGLWIIGGVTRLARRVAEKRGLDETLTPFLSGLVKWLLRALLFISVAAMVGVETTSFVALIGAAGLAVGLALQGSLANFAGGVLILVFRPYKVGDLIEAQGHLGVVKEVQVFTTTLVNGQNKRIIIPNGPMSNGTVVNYTVEGRLRVDMVVGVGYSSDIDKAKSILMDIVKKDERVMTEPAPLVEVVELADSSVNIAVRPHTTPDNYWGVFFDTLTNAKKALDQAGIEIPFPQRDVHIHNNS